MLIYLFLVAQLAVLQYHKIFIKSPVNYADYTDIFSLNLAIKLGKNTNINEHTIKLIDGKQFAYGPIYALSLLELEMLKTYIEIHLKTGFI